MEKFTVLVGIIAVYDNRILLTQRSLKVKFLPGVWGIPAGKIDFGEEVETAIHRELKEEVGLTGKIRKIVGANTFWGVKDGVKLHNVQINYIVDLDSDRVILDESSNDYTWVNISEYEKSGLSEFHLKTLSQAFS